ncbi:MAG: antibiotic biosynthesis monooxygenase [Pseudomonadota bacterium]
MSYITMNRFRVKLGSEADFEAVWLGRETFLHEVPGFKAFHLLKGPTRDDHTLYASHTTWETEEAFLAWTRSEAFRKAHAGAGDTKPAYLGHPELESFHILQTV